MSAERYGEYLIWTYSQNTQLVFQGKSLSYYDRAKSMTDLSGVGSIIGADVSGSVMEIHFNPWIRFKHDFTGLRLKILTSNQPVNYNVIVVTSAKLVIQLRLFSFQTNIALIIIFIILDHFLVTWLKSKTDSLM